MSSVGEKSLGIDIQPKEQQVLTDLTTPKLCESCKCSFNDLRDDQLPLSRTISKDDVLMGSQSNLRDIGNNLEMGIKNNAITNDYVLTRSLSNLRDFGNVDMDIKNNLTSKDYVLMGSLSNLRDIGNVDMGIKNKAISKDHVLMGSRTNLRHFGNVNMGIKNNATSKDDVLMGSRSNLRDIGNNLDMGIENNKTSKDDVLMGSRSNLRDIANSVNMDIQNNATSKDDVLMGSQFNLRHFGNVDMGIKNNAISRDDILIGSRSNLGEIYNDAVMGIKNNSTSDLEDCSIKNSPNENKETLVNSEELAQCEPESSLPIPDGLAMDPLSPTALAVPSDLMDRIGSGLSLLRDHGKKVQKYLWKNRKFEVSKKTWKSMVTIVLVEARDLPDGPSNNSNGLYCKFRLGNESHKSKQVLKSKPVWRERFNLHFYDDSKLEIIVWHKVKQKNFMGRCTIDLSQYERERTHDIWQDLDCGYGSLHLLVTLCGAERNAVMDNVLTTHEVHHSTPADDKYLWYRLDNSWSEVGQLSVTVHSAKGLSALSLSGNVDAYCILELDNSRVQTHVVHCTSDPYWNKNFIFAVHDITSTLDITVYDESIIQSMKGETLGKISIPLLRIKNGEKKWYALKDRSKKSSAKGNCPRILLEMSLVWNPVKASFRVLSPKETKYVQKATKFDIPLIYSNLKFIKNVFTYIQVGNDHFKRLFEWDNQEKSAVALGAWLIFWYFFRMWMTPLLLVLPFAHNWILQRNNNMPAPTYNFDDDTTDEDVDTHKDEKTLKMRIFGLQDLTITIKTAIDYIVSLLERINNLLNFSVPYLSYLVMIALVAASIALYVIPINYIFMAFGIYKFTRKFLNPRRVPNNDILDFISRVPDNQTLKQWQELKVPEPVNKLESIKGR